MSPGSVLSGIARLSVPLRVAAVTGFVLVTCGLLPPGHGAAASGGGGPHIYLQEGRDLAVRYAGAAGLVQPLESGQAEPLSLAQGDFHGDGVAGLAVGYATPGGNLLAVHEGNLDAFAPQSRSSWEAIRDGLFPPPFLPRARVLAAPARPDFLQAGAFAGQGRLDLATAARGGRTLYVLPGEGHGTFGTPVALELPGAVTALAAGSFGTAGPFTSLLVAVSDDGGSSLLLYQGSSRGLQRAGVFALPAPATQLAFGDLDGDSLPDAAVVAGGEVLILHAAHGADAGAAGRQAPVLQSASLPLSVSALALGRFLFDRAPQLQMALLAADGSLHLAAHAGLDARPWSPAEVSAMLAHRGRPAAAGSGRSAAAAAPPGLPAPSETLDRNDQEGWTIVETFAGTSPLGDPGQPPLLLRGNVSSRGADDVLLLDGEAGRMVVVSHPNLAPGAASFGPGARSVLAYPSGKPVAALAARVGAEARPGLIVLHQGRPSPSVNMPLPDPTFTVNTTADTVDANPGDGVCADSQGNCSLRAAVMEANATPGNDTIMVPAGTFTLTIPNNFQYNATGGHLDVNDGLTIVGAGQGSTIIQAGTTAANGIDKVFSIAAPQATGLGPSFATSISNLTIQFGLNTDTNDPFGGAFDWDAGANGNGSISITSCTIQSNSAASSQTSLDDGGGMFFSNEAGNTGTVTIANSTISGNTAQDDGGGLFVGTAVPLTLSNTQVLNNQAIGSGAQQGGGLVVFGPSGANQSAVHGGRIASNQAGAQGGGIWATAGLLIDQGTVISGNSSSGTGGGLWTAATNETTTITDATFTANSATGTGGAIQADSSSGNTVNMSFSRIVGNTASAGTGLENVAAAVSATDDWWGCNGGPGTAGCDAVSGTATTSPWLVLRASGNPSTIIVGNATTVTASLLTDSQNNVIAASNLAALAPIPVAWSNPVHCTLANPQPNIVSGTATATCTGSSAGAGALTAAIDNASATAAFAVTDFSLSISPTSKNAVVNGGSAVYTVTVTPINNFCGTVNLSVIGFAVRGKPPLATPIFNPPTIIISCSAPAPGSSQLTVTTSSTTPIQAIPFTVSGSSGNPLQTRNSPGATLNVTDFAISLSPSSAQQLVVGGSLNYTLQISAVNGFTGTVNITSCSVAPAGAGVTLSGCPTSLTIPSPASATLTLSATLSATLQPYTISVTGKSADAPADSHGATAQATTTDFSLSISPATATVISGTNGSFLVTVSPLNGFTGQVNITCSWSPTGPGTQGCPPSVTITSGAVNFTLTPSTGGIALQTYTLTVRGTSAAAPADTHLATAQMTVAPLILRPTAFTAFSTPGYSSPANAADGNAGTFSAGPNTAGILNEEDWSGFSTITGTPTQVLLKVTSAANCTSSSNDGVEIQYSKDGTHNNDTLIYQLGLFAGVAPQPRALQTDVITLPTTQNPANVRVLALVFSQSSTGCHQVYDAWLEIKF